MAASFLGLPRFGLMHVPDYSCYFCFMKSMWRTARGSWLCDWWLVLWYWLLETCQALQFALLTLAHAWTMVIIVILCMVLVAEEQHQQVTSAASDTVNYHKLQQHKLSRPLCTLTPRWPCEEVMVHVVICIIMGCVCVFCFATSR